MKRLRTIAVFPTLFTLGNLVCGFFSIVVASRIEAPKSVDVPRAAAIERSNFARMPRFDPADPTHNIMFSVTLIFAAMIFDALDGHVARLSRTSSDFGAELDSLADLVTFGVAPAFLMVKMCPTFTFLHQHVVWAVAATFAICAALRLARFNVETPEDDAHANFSGLPTPAAAAAIAGFAWMFYILRNENNTLAHAEQIDGVLQTALAVFAVLISLLMVSRVPYPHLMNRLFKGQRSFGHIVGLVFAVLSLMTMPGITIPVLCCSFVLLGPIRYVWLEFVRRQPHEEPMF